MTEPMTEQRLEFFEAVSGGWITEFCAEIRRLIKVNAELYRENAFKLRASEMREIEATKRLEAVEGFACKACANNEREAERLLAQVSKLDEEACRAEMERMKVLEHTRELEASIKRKDKEYDDMAHSWCKRVEELENSQDAPSPQHALIRKVVEAGLSLQEVISKLDEEKS